MEEEAELLDWGNEDDEQQQLESNGSQRYLIDSRDDAEDAVSLGGDEDDMQDFAAYQSHPHQHSEGPLGTSFKPSSSSQQQSSHSVDSRDPQTNKSPRKDSSHHRRSHSQSLSKLIHALPPKPVLIDPDFGRQPPTQISTLASSMVRRERRSNGQSKAHTASSETNDSLPPDWEIRHPRNDSGDVYFYNVVTFESTWTRPTFSGSGESSPYKDKGNDRTPLPRSPRLSGAEDVPLTLTDRNGSRPKREAKARRASSANGDPLSYEDRHYRPGEASQPPITNEYSDRKDARSSRRSPSPRPSESRRPRSVTPPRTGHRRELSPPAQGARREPVRDVPSRLSSPPPDRGWGRQRVEDSRSQSPDRLSVSRGRRQRGDIDSPEMRPSSYQDQRFRDDNLRDVPTQRHRSPPHMRDSASPTNNRRTPQVRDTLPPAPYQGQGRYARSHSPPQERGGGGGRHHDIYIPSDSVPQRRPRDLDASLADDHNENQPKRRRVDEPTDAIPGRRDAPIDYPLLSQSSSVPDTPMSTLTINETEQPRARRKPLPPQSTRFRQAQQNASASIGALGPTFSQHGMRPTSELPPPTRPASFADVPSGPRGHAQSGRDQDSERRQPPTKPSGRRATRFGDSQQTPVSGLGGQGRDVGGGDPPRFPVQRPEESSSRPASMYSDRSNDMQVDSLPKGPRAMTQGNAPGIYSQSASGTSVATFGNARPGQDSKMRRALPPHLTNGFDGRGSRDRGDLPSSTPKGPAAGNSSSGPYRRGGGQNDAAEARRQDARERRAPKLSGTNSVPIGNRRSFPPENNVESARLPASSSSVERIPGNDDNLSRYQDDYTRPYQPEKESPSSLPRGLPITSDNRRYSQGNRDDFMEVEALRSPVDSYPPSSQRQDHRYAQENRTRQFRFGAPTRDPEVSDRTWHARDEPLDRPSRSPVVNSSRLPPLTPSQSSPAGVSWSGSYNDEPKRSRIPDSDRHYEPAPQREDFEEPSLPRESHPREHPAGRNKGRFSPVQVRARSRSNAQHESRTMTTLPAPPPSLPPRPVDSFHNEPRRGYEDNHGESREGPAPTYRDRPVDSHDEPPPAQSRDHPRHSEHRQHNSHAGDSGSRRDSKPVRIKRPARSPAVDDTRASTSYEPEGGGNVPDRDGRGDKGGRGTRRGGSLLDRLALDGPSQGSSSPAPSLRDRVDVPMKRAGDGPSDLAAVPMAGGGFDGEGESSGKGGRGKRRNGKPRRGRKSAAP